MAGQWAWNSPASVKLNLPIRATRRDCPLFSLMLYIVYNIAEIAREVDGKLHLPTLLRQLFQVP